MADQRRRFSCGCTRIAARRTAACNCGYGDGGCFGSRGQYSTGGPGRWRRAHRADDQDVRDLVLHLEGGGGAIHHAGDASRTLSSSSQLLVSIHCTLSSRTKVGCCDAFARRSCTHNANSLSLRFSPRRLAVYGVSPMPSPNSPESSGT
eukprot:scaffold39939_cov30-Tisochrysis_lutea.AAC.4